MEGFIFVILMDVPTEHEADFNHIYDTDHLSHMMKVPGNLRCNRYRLDWSDNADMQKYICLYEIADPSLPRSAAWKAQSELGEWGTRMRHHVRNRSNGVFRQIASHGAAGSHGTISDSEAIYFLQQAIPSPLEDRFNHLYDHDHIPHMLQTPGVAGARRYRLEWSMTEGIPPYLAIYDIDAPQRPRSPEWKAQTNKGAWPTEMRPHFTARRNGAYSRIARHSGTAS